MAEKCKFLTFVEDADVINEVAEKAQAVLDKENHITISNPDAIPTIVHAFLEGIIKKLDNSKKLGQDVSINLFNQLEMGVDSREDEDEDKESNFTPYAVPGQAFKLGIKSDSASETD